jgi:hypothetical protein
LSKHAQDMRAGPSARNWPLSASSLEGLEGVQNA